MGKVMKKPRLLSAAALLGALVICSVAHAQGYIGFVYPAGAQRGTTTNIRVGGQRIDIVEGAIVSGTGVQAKLVEYHSQLQAQASNELRLQLRELQQAAKELEKKGEKLDPVSQKIMENIERRFAEMETFPANRAIVNLAFLEITVAPDAVPGPREIRLITTTGVTNPLTFHIGQYPEFARPAIKTCQMPVLGNEQAAERRRADEEKEMRVTIPCVVNGQVAPGWVNHYRFQARKGQRLVIKVYARDLIPYMADAVPGWFQPAITLYNGQGRELAYSDGFRFKPDPLIYFQVPDDGEYVVAISDALFRGREDFVYRISIAESPFVTSIFPLGCRVGDAPTVQMKGWNLEGANLMLPPKDAKAGVHYIAAAKGNVLSNHVPFALDTLPECIEQEPNDDRSKAQKIPLPMIVNGRIDRPGDWDVYQIEGRAGDKIVAEVTARRLDSPVDSLLKLTDANGKLLAVNDDHEDPAAGLNTYHADSYIMFELPADGTYYVHIGETTGKGGEEYGYRLRLSAPIPDFALRVVPSAVSMRSASWASVRVFVIPKDGFHADIQLSLKDPPEGFAPSTAVLKAGQEFVQLGFKTTLTDSKTALPLKIEGRAKLGEQEIVRQAVPAEDRMQAFLWRHLAPVGDLVVRVYDPNYQPPRTRIPPPLPPEMKEAALKAAQKAVQEGGKPKFTKAQVAGRVRMLDYLYENWLLTDKFYHEKIAECEAVE